MQVTKQSASEKYEMYEFHHWPYQIYVHLKKG